MASFGRALKDRVLGIFGVKNPAYTNTIGIGGTSQPTDNSATWNYGFPSRTMTPVDTSNPTGGGIPPNGKDFNGVLNSISAECYNAMNGILPSEWIAPNVWTSVDSKWKGYPVGAIVIYPTGSTSTPKKLYQSVSANNLDMPSSSGQWIELSPQKSFLPDWGSAQTTTELPFTMPFDGWVNLVLVGKYNTRIGLSSNGKTIQVAWAWSRGTDYESTMTNTFLCAQGDSIVFIDDRSRKDITLNYCPFKK